MGKPFKQELLQLKDTYEWAINLDISSLKKIISETNLPIYFVGSGGSLSACYLGVSLSEQMGRFSKALTPLELYNLKNTIKNSVVIFISASGKNSDILFGFNTAIRFQAKSIISICMQPNSKLSELSKKYSISKFFEFSLPVGKDGFLATNSLIAYFVILIKLFGYSLQVIDFENQLFLKEIEDFTEKIGREYSISVLYGQFSKCVAYDIESKSIEAALYPILLSDFRNFGHGRHHWYAKKGTNSGIIALATEEDAFLAKKTLEALPLDVPKLILKSKFKGFSSSLDLLIKSFYLIDKLGDSHAIDPGRPGVPSFGRVLYNLKYSNALTSKERKHNLSQKAISSISRKIHKPLSELSVIELNSWNKAYEDYLKNLNKTSFGAIVFDYDGTLCSDERKFEGPSYNIVEKLETILQKGFYIGIVTGRGKSVRKDLQKVLDIQYWDQVIIGYYNGADIGMLKDNDMPNLNRDVDDKLNEVYELLNNRLDLNINCTLRPNQLTVEFDKENISFLKETVMQVVKSRNNCNLEILESSHSIDIISNGVSKNNVFVLLNQILKDKCLPINSLCIGDMGKWPGNDYKLLNNSFGLSVLEVNNSKNSCWNITPAGITNIEATLYYLDKLRFESDKIKFKITK